jgi:hypothetical protein
MPIQDVHQAASKGWRASTACVHMPLMRIPAAPTHRAAADIGTAPIHTSRAPILHIATLLQAVGRHT